MSVVSGLQESPAAAASKPATLGIVCGGGEFPIVVAEAAQKAGWSVVLFAIRGFADRSVERFPHEWVTLGSAGHFLARARSLQCRDLIFLGTVTRPRLRDIRLDWTTVRLIPHLLRLLRGGDDHLLSGMARHFESVGFRLHGAHEVAPDILVPAGALGAHRPRQQDQADITCGIAVLRAMGPLDVGQAVVVAAGHVIAVEAAEGTDLMLTRCRELRQLGRVATPAGTGVLIKAAKPLQDRRFDLPSIGVRTVENAATAGLAGIAVEAGGSIVPDLQALIEAADAAGLFIVGVDLGGAG